MRTPFSYEFGYAWPITWGPAIPLALCAAFLILAWWRGWPRWILAVSGGIAVWMVVALVFIHGVFRLNLPMRVPSAQFLATGTGSVVDVGAGSGRAGIGLLLERPGVRVTAIDIYSGFWGISENTPERFMRNAAIAGVADRAEARVGDARALPLPDAAYDGVISAFAIDHLRRADVPTALTEVHRVLRPDGQFLLAIVNVDWWTILVSPPIAHHPRADRARWRALLTDAGFDVLEEGRSPASLHFLGLKRTPRTAVAVH